MNAVVTFITAALQLAPLLIQLGEDLIPVAERIYAVATQSGDPTDEDWAFLHEQQDKMNAIINAPIPGENT